MVEITCKFLQKRLDDMLYVGLTENHKESATMFANVVGTQAISQFTSSRSHGDHAANNNSGQFRSTLFHRIDVLATNIPFLFYGYHVTVNGGMNISLNTLSRRSAIHFFFLFIFVLDGVSY